MCGIVGFIGENQAAPILLDGLAKLEYRGYDSAGIAVRDGISSVHVVKAKGKLSELLEKTDNGNSVKGTCGIGHTRWATHGEPSVINAHPHVSGVERRALIFPNDELISCVLEVCASLSQLCDATTA
jgi:glucosamine--fructose-6-phosphate aminotransferase (isomerizing)